ncbi:MAG: MFS transporter [Ruminococcaceae bacterium]|nr:MFS transporter [Oscillospiraceae bacterium]
MKKISSFKHTVMASYIGYITQAIVNNFAPLLFVTFHTVYGIPLGQIGLLVSINFIIQITVDLIAAKFVSKTGYRIPIIAAHIFAACGLVSLAILPDLMPSAYAGIAVSVMIYGIGGGLIEVLISPIVEACPGDDKKAAMSILHSFYCWGSVAVVALSTLLFSVLGIDSWKIVACLWALIPLFNVFYFALVPLNTLDGEGKTMSVSELLKSKIFWILALIMVCSGASELSMSQWASAFAEKGLGVSKTIGDLAGPCFFAVLMGSSRIFHAKFGGRIDLTKYLGGCAVLCIFSYLLASLSPIPIISLLGCGICGISVAAMWPGTFSLASEKCPRGGTAMFALLALAGDTGCASGPYIVGAVSSVLGDNISLGLLSAAAFPILMIVGLILCRAVIKNKK